MESTVSIESRIESWVKQLQDSYQLARTRAVDQGSSTKNSHYRELLQGNGFTCHNILPKSISERIFNIR